MDAIGGYFSVELPKQVEYYRNAICLYIVRNLLDYIISFQIFVPVIDLSYWWCLPTDSEYQFAENQVSAYRPAL